MAILVVGYHKAKSIADPKAVTIIIVVAFLACLIWNAKEIKVDVGQFFFNLEYEKASKPNASVSDVLRLAQIYDTGKFLGAPDKKKAKKWYREAARRGSVVAKEILCWYHKDCFYYKRFIKRRF